MFFSVYTLGCKLNQLETEAIADSFCREGFTYVPWGSGERGSIEQSSGEPSILVINTCTVTSMADQKARRIIRRALKDYPRACLIITGCYAQMEKEALTALEAECGSRDYRSVQPHRLFVIPGEIKDRLLELPRFLTGTEDVSALPGLVASWFDTLSMAAGPKAAGSFSFRPENFVSHSRGFLKIQDGCDHRCAYCRVSLARGKSRSLAAAEVLGALQTLEDRGYAEAVLTGVNITQYRDTDAGFPGLPALLDFLLKETGKIRIRLSSIEPDEFTSGQNGMDYARVLAHPRIRPHFHLSVQSGSPDILAKMGRPYSPEDIEHTADLLRSVREDPFLACDIIAGFPGETETEFEKTRKLCEGIGFAWIHAFPFSRRPGTAAYDFPDQIPEKDAAGRVELLTELARKGRREYLGRWEGKEVEAIVEKGSQLAIPGLPGVFVPGVSENYLKLLIDCGGEPAPAPGSLIRCIISRNQGLLQDSARISGSAASRFDALAERTADTICIETKKAIYY